MDDENKTREQLVKELAALRKRVLDLETNEARQIQTKNDLRQTIANLEQQMKESRSELADINATLKAHEAERKELELTLAEEHNLLTTLFDNLADFVYVKDKSCRFVMNNKSHLQALGNKTQVEVTGKTDFDFFPVEFAERFYAGDQEVFETGFIVSREEPFLDQKNLVGWVRATKVPLRDSTGNIVGLVGVSQDITKQKQLEEELQQALERRDRQVNLSTQLAQDIAAAANLTALYQRVVAQVQKQFEYYHTQLLRYDPETEDLSLISGYGEVGIQMMTQAHKMPLGIWPKA